MFDKIFEKLALHDRAIKKLVEVTDKHYEIIDGLVERAETGAKVGIVQTLINTHVDTRLSKLEDASMTERIDHMEEYIDKLTKRVKELESKSNSQHTCSSNVCHHGINIK